MFLRKSATNGILAAIFVAVAPGGACAQEPIVAIKGYVLDSACAFLKRLEKPVSGLRARLRQSRVSPGDPRRRQDDLLANLERDARFRTELPPNEICGAESDRQREGV